MVSGDCANELITFTDNSTSQDPLVAWEWDFGGIAQSFDPSANFQIGQSGDFVVSLTTTTDQGCNQTETKTLDMKEPPASSFEASSTIGGSPLVVNFTNTSINASSYLWDFGTGSTSDEENPSGTFTEIDTHVVTLVAVNADNCSDTSSLDIEVVQSQLDLALSEINASIDNGMLQLVITVANLGLVRVDTVDVEIEVENELPELVQIVQEISPGEVINFPLSIDASTTAGSSPSYICVYLLHRGINLEDLDLTNNQECLSLEEQAQVLAPFPNPARDIIVIPIIVPDPEGKMRYW